jgi:Acetyltransferase (GNAT) domain
MLGLAATGDAFIELLELDGRAIAAGLFVVHGDTAFFWKTAYDDALAKHSPGALLDLALTERLFHDLRIRFLDTGTDDSVDPASMIWGGRAAHLNAVLDLAPGSARGMIISTAQRARAALRRWRADRAVKGQEKRPR